MHRALQILSIFSALLIGNQVYAQWTNPQLDQIHVGAIDKDEAPIIWKLSLTSGSQSCAISFVRDSKQDIALQTSNECEEFLAGIRQLKRMDTNANGDITLYGAADQKLAEFMQSESGDHESFWPNYPLMTLAPVN